MDIKTILELVFPVICVGAIFAVCFLIYTAIEHKRYKETKNLHVDIIESFGNLRDFKKELSEWFSKRPHLGLDDVQIQFELGKYQSSYIAIILYRL